MKTVRTIQKEFYGDTSRWFIATVVNSSPPYGLEGRVKVRIHGVHSPNTLDIPEKDLPWAQVITPATEAGVSGLGRTPKLTTGALVFGFFVDGLSSQVPLIIGSLSKSEFPTDIQSRFTYDKLSLDRQPYQFPILTSDVADASIKKDFRRSESMRFFVDNGYTLEQAAGITGNLEHASGLDPDGNGLGDWNDIRLAKLLTFSRNFIQATGKSEDDLSKSFGVQLRFVLFELTGEKNIANGKLLRSRKIEGDDGSSIIMKKYYIDNFDPVDTDDVLKLCIKAKREVA